MPRTTLLLVCSLNVALACSDDGAGGTVGARSGGAGDGDGSRGDGGDGERDSDTDGSGDGDDRPGESGGSHGGDRVGPGSAKGDGGGGDREGAEGIDDDGHGGGSGDGEGSGGDGGVANGIRVYEGFGALTRGHQDCPETWEAYVVTSLDDEGEGTLRDAVGQPCRLITFAVGGTITLARTLNIRYSFITIDGASAPPPGITVVQPGAVATTIEARNSTGPVSDVIIHHLRMDGTWQGGDQEGADIWGIDGEAHPVSRIIIDHVTAKGAKDGVFDMWSDVDDVTLSWNLIHGTLKMLHLSTGDIGLDRDRISIHHNVFAGNNERQIRIRHDSELIDYVNNIIYGWGWMEGGAAGLHVAYDEGEVNPSLNVVGNLFHFVSGLDGAPDDAIKWERGNDVGDLYFDGNIVPAGEADGVGNSDALAIPADAQVTTFPAVDLAVMVLPHAGTHYPNTEEMMLVADISDAL